MFQPSQKIREATHAGSWYIGDRKQLDAQLNDFLSKAKAETIPNIKAIIGPHAGFSYSGPTAAFAYQHLVQKEGMKVFLLGPCHHTYIKGIGLSELEIYETPLGNIELDQPTIKQLSAELKKNFIFTNKEVEEEEHSLEMHLPFIYKVFPKCKLIPIMVGATTEQQDAQVASVLVKYFVDPNTVFVISSDFCHWGKSFRYTPYNKEHGEIHQSITQLDGQAIKLIESHNIPEFYKYLEDTKNTICGRHPICVLLNIINLSKLQLRTQLTKYNQSNQVTKPNDSSVSYAALVTSLI
ncbi:unnamed protein product (macronuclear) [Paramecium tetraurelia]|uniref:MEMO1 family protein n=1 Tax=Paramecium tetraurelia TaxID=5888 RepID=A0CXP4_PARTE|nr:uncharacterized protein GSPATT00011193001 [Paramecium tetraurelia]CAK75561.1 unnamed protein product [Paramecium tetraurelia]|eukprot:XP_001442958.1 hypothetical protein (macronuclear) [Paramecium tetraurelia strain d4-2]